MEMYSRGEELRIESCVTTVRQNRSKLNWLCQTCVPMSSVFSSLMIPHALIWSSGFCPRLVSSLVSGVCQWLSYYSVYKPCVSPSLVSAAIGLNPCYVLVHACFMWVCVWMNKVCYYCDTPSSPCSFAPEQILTDLSWMMIQLLIAWLNSFHV